MTEAVPEPDPADVPDTDVPDTDVPDVENPPEPETEATGEDTE